MGGFSVLPVEFIDVLWLLLKVCDLWDGGLHPEGHLVLGDPVL